MKRDIQDLKRIMEDGFYSWGETTSNPFTNTTFTDKGQKVACDAVREAIKTYGTHHHDSHGIPYYEVVFKNPVKSTVTGENIYSVQLRTMTGFIILHSLEFDKGYGTDLLYMSEIRMVMNEIEKSIS